MASFQSGMPYVNSIGQNLSIGGRIPAEEIRRKYNFGNSVSHLNVDMAPFYVFMSKMRRKATNDPNFKNLVYRDNTLLKRRFRVTATGGVMVSAKGAPTRSFTLSGANIEGGIPNYLLKNHVITWKTTYRSGTEGASPNQTAAAAHDVSEVRIHTARITDIAGGNLTCVLTSPNTFKVNEADAGTPFNVVIPEGSYVEIAGTAFDEGSYSPDTWRDTLDTDYGFTQIFKTACDMTNSSMATEYRGYEDEWHRLWGMKMKEHDLDIERAITFGNKFRDGKASFTDGIASSITRHPSSLGWSVQKYGNGSFHYDDLLGMSEAYFDEGVGASTDKLCLVGSKVLSYFNKIGSGSFLDSSVSNSWLKADINLDKKTGLFGHKITTLETIHGNYHMVKHPGLKGAFANLMLIVDFNHINWRPLVGNGKNRDTHILTNVQPNDADYRKDMIVTEGGLQIDFPELHGYIYFMDENEQADTWSERNLLTNEQKASDYFDNSGDIGGDGNFSEEIPE